MGLPIRQRYEPVLEAITWHTHPHYKEMTAKTDAEPVITVEVLNIGGEIVPNEIKARLGQHPSRTDRTRIRLARTTTEVHHLVVTITKPPGKPRETTTIAAIPLEMDPQDLQCHLLDKEKAKPRLYQVERLSIGARMDVDGTEPTIHRGT